MFWACLVYTECSMRRSIFKFIQTKAYWPFSSGKKYIFFDSSSKCTISKHLVDNFQLQFYLIKNLTPQCIRFLTKYRLSSHKLNIEYGRFIKRARKIMYFM